MTDIDIQASKTIYSHYPGSRHRRPLSFVHCLLLILTNSPDHDHRHRKSVINDFIQDYRQVNITPKVYFAIRWPKNAEKCDEITGIIGESIGKQMGKPFKNGQPMANEWGTFLPGVERFIYAAVLLEDAPYYGHWPYMVKHHTNTNWLFFVVVYKYIYEQLLKYYWEFQVKFAHKDGVRYGTNYRYTRR